jgi:hypothetical protein
MKFLDISLTTDSSLLLYAIHSAFYWQISKKTIVLSYHNLFTKTFPTYISDFKIFIYYFLHYIIVYLGLKNPYKKISETRKLESIHE